jgi:hypothetical protein
LIFSNTHYQTQFLQDIRHVTEGYNFHTDNMQRHANSTQQSLFKKLTVAHPVKKLPVSYGTRRFITAFTRARHRFLSWTRWIQSTHPNPAYTKQLNGADNRCYTPSPHF